MPWNQIYDLYALSFINFAIPRFESFPINEN